VATNLRARTHPGLDPDTLPSTDDLMPWYLYLMGRTAARCEDRLLNASTDVRAPMKIGRYEILDEIGKGAMGTVYRARDPLIERTVAIKTVPIEQLQQEGTDAESRFLREAQSAGRLSHPTS
jgi:hypothetical protein